MKKAVVFALTGIMAVSMFGCGSKKQVEVSSVDDLKELTIGVQSRYYRRQLCQRCSSK